MAAAIAGLTGMAVTGQAQEPLTANTPATLLVVHDPYFSVWSFHDQLNGGETRHWTGAHEQLMGVVLRLKTKRSCSFMRRHSVRWPFLRGPLPWQLRLKLKRFACLPDYRSPISVPA